MHGLGKMMKDKVRDTCSNLGKLHILKAADKPRLKKDRAIYFPHKLIACNPNSST